MDEPFEDTIITNEKTDIKTDENLDVKKNLKKYYQRFPLNL